MYKKIKLIFVVSTLSSGGQERQLIELLKGLVQKDNIFFRLVIMTNVIYYKEFCDLKIPIDYIKRRHRKDITIFYKFFKYCKKVKPDIIHSWGPTPACYSFLISKLLNIKFINGFIRNAFIPKILDNNWIRAKITFPFSDIIIANSRAGLESYGLLNNKKGKVIYNGFDFNRMKNIKSKNKIKKIFNINTKYIIGMVSAFSDTKDYKTYIKAAEYVLQKHNDVSFVTVGDGPNLNKCKKLVSPINKEKIKFLGIQQDIESIVNIFDIGILTTYTEGISNSLMEYMALNKPVIATNGGGTKELVIDNKTGYLISRGDSSVLACKIIFLLKHQDVAQKMGNAGQNRLIKIFNLDNMVNSYIEIYKKIANSYYKK